MLHSSVNTQTQLFACGVYLGESLRSDSFITEPEVAICWNVPCSVNSRCEANTLVVSDIFIGSWAGKRHPICELKIKWQYSYE